MNNKTIVKELRIGYCEIVENWKNYDWDETDEGGNNITYRTVNNNWVNTFLYSVLPSRIYTNFNWDE